MQGDLKMDIIFLNENNEEVCRSLPEELVEISQLPQSGQDFITNQRPFELYLNLDIKRFKIIKEQAVKYIDNDVPEAPVYIKDSRFYIGGRTAIRGYQKEEDLLNV